MAHNSVEVITLSSSDEETNPQVENLRGIKPEISEKARKPFSRPTLSTGVKVDPHPVVVPPLLVGNKLNPAYLGTASSNSSENTLPSKKTARKSFKSSSTSKMVSTSKNQKHKPSQSKTESPSKIISKTVAAITKLPGITIQPVGSSTTKLANIKESKQIADQQINPKNANRYFKPKATSTPKLNNATMKKVAPGIAANFKKSSLVKAKLSTANVPSISSSSSKVSPPSLKTSGNVKGVPILNQRPLDKLISPTNNESAVPCSSSSKVTSNLPTNLKTSIPPNISIQPVIANGTNGIKRPVQNAESDVPLSLLVTFGKAGITITNSNGVKVGDLNEKATQAIDKELTNTNMGKAKLANSGITKDTNTSSKSGVVLNNKNLVKGDPLVGFAAKPGIAITPVNVDEVISKNHPTNNKNVKRQNKNLSDNVKGININSTPTTKDAQKSTSVQKTYKVKHITSSHTTKDNKKVSLEEFVSSIKVKKITSKDNQSNDTPTVRCHNQSKSNLKDSPNTHLYKLLKSNPAVSINPATYSQKNYNLNPKPMENVGKDVKRKRSYSKTETIIISNKKLKKDGTHDKNPNLVTAEDNLKRIAFLKESLKKLSALKRKSNEKRSGGSSKERSDRQSKFAQNTCTLKDILNWNKTKQGPDKDIASGKEKLDPKNVLHKDILNAKPQKQVTSPKLSLKRKTTDNTRSPSEKKPKLDFNNLPNNAKPWNHILNNGQSSRSSSPQLADPKKVIPLPYISSSNSDTSEPQTMKVIPLPYAPLRSNTPSWPSDQTKTSNTDKYSRNNTPSRPSAQVKPSDKDGDSRNNTPDRPSGQVRASDKDKDSRNNTPDRPSGQVKSSDKDGYSRNNTPSRPSGQTKPSYGDKESRNNTPSRPSGQIKPSDKDRDSRNNTPDRPSGQVKASDKVKDSQKNTPDQTIKDKDSTPWKTTDDNKTKFKQLLEYSKSFMVATASEKSKIVKNFHKLLDKAIPTYVNSSEFSQLIDDTLQKIKNSSDTFVQLKAIRIELKAYKRRKEDSFSSRHSSSSEQSEKVRTPLTESPKALVSESIKPNLTQLPKPLLTGQPKSPVSEPPKSTLIVPSMPPVTKSPTKVHEIIGREALASAIQNATKILKLNESRENNNSLHQLLNIPSTSRQADIVENIRLSMPISNSKGELESISTNSNEEDLKISGLFSVNAPAKDSTKLPATLGPEENGLLSMSVDATESNFKDINQENVVINLHSPPPGDVTSSNDLENQPSILMSGLKQADINKDPQSQKSGCIGTTNDLDHTIVSPEEPEIVKKVGLSNTVDGNVSSESDFKDVPSISRQADIVDDLILTMPEDFCVPSTEDITRRENEKAALMSHLGLSSKSTKNIKPKGEVSKPISKASDSKETKEEKLERRVKFLENHLSKLDKRIKKLQAKELSLDDLDDEDSNYILEDRYKKKFQKTWQTLCKLKKRSHLVGREIDRRFYYQGSRHDLINKAIEKLINKRTPTQKFPYYKEVLDLINKVNEQTQLSLGSYDIENEAREAFENIGVELKKRRQMDEERDFGCYLTDNHLEMDPADQDEALREKLTTSVAEGERKIKEIIDKYASEQVEKPNSDEEVEGSDCEDEPAEGKAQASDSEEPIGEEKMDDDDHEKPISDEKMEVSDSEEPIREEKVERVNEEPNENSPASLASTVPNSPAETDEGEHFPSPLQRVTSPSLDVIDIGSSSDASTDPGIVYSSQDIKNSSKQSNTTCLFIPSSNSRIFIRDEIEIVENDPFGGNDSSPELPSLSEMCS